MIKHIAGPAARQHGRIAILVACGGPLNTFAFIIRAHIGAGSVTRHFDGIPAGSRCTVSKASNGHTKSVDVHASRSVRVTVPATGNVVAHLADRFVHAVAVTRPPPPRVTG